MSECLSVRGEWGEVCPDCGQRLPAAQGPLTSWQAEHVDQPAPTSRTLASEVQRDRWDKRTRANNGRISIAQIRDVHDLLVRNGGNREAASRDLGLATSYVRRMATRAAEMGFEVPPPARRGANFRRAKRRQPA